MRPVDKGGRGTYPYHLAFNYNSETMTFKKKVIKNLFHTYKPTLLTCMRNWRNVAKVNNDQMDSPTHFAQMVDAAGTFETRIGGLYRQAAQPLLNRLGSWCSYCETYLPNQVEVEHILAKSQYPDFCLDWENFLLGCGPCNGKAAKGNRPTRSRVVTDFLDDDQPGDETDYYDTIRNKYQWPDTDTTTYQALLPILEYYAVSQGAWVVLPPDRSVQLDMRFDSEDVSERTTWAYVHTDTPPNLRLRKVRVMIEEPNSYSENTVDLFKLNATGKLTSITDRRMMHRTKAWFDVLLNLKALSQMPDAGSFEVLWGLLLRNALTAGFYSVWVRILDLSAMRDFQNNLLVTRFVDETNQAGYYPHTRTDRIPN